ncbi:MAG TPA: hypothetical protein VIX89_02430 [Bryobacteraceae bacterium]
MDNHVKVLGLLFILAGGFGGIASLVFFLLAGPASVTAYGQLIGFVVTGWMWLLLILAAPAIVVGIGLLYVRPWSRTAGTVIAILELINFPIGTGIGMYALWVLMSEDTDPLFSPRFR